MKMQSLVLFVALSISGLSYAAREREVVYKDVDANIQEAYIPGGFDSTAEAYVVVSGIFPNGCYKWKEARVEKADSSHHSVRVIASVKQGDICPRMLVPYMKEVSLGRLNSGSHEVKFLNGDGTFFTRSLVIE